MSPRQTQLGSAEKLQLAWTLLWPCAILGLLYWLVKDLLRPTGQSLATVDSALALCQLFFFAPCVVRRAVRMEFPGFHLLVDRRRPGEERRNPTYLESLSITWLILWRTAVIQSLTILVMYAAFRTWSGSVPVFLNLQYPVLAGVPGILRQLTDLLIELLIFFLWIIPAALRKNYAGFSLRVIPAARPVFSIDNSPAEV